MFHDQPPSRPLVPPAPIGGATWKADLVTVDSHGNIQRRYRGRHGLGRRCQIVMNVVTESRNGYRRVEEGQEVVDTLNGDTWVNQFHRC